MPTLIADVERHQIIVASAVSASGHAGPPERKYRSLLDTGSQITLISQRVVRDIGAASIDAGQFMPASGEPVKTDKYNVTMNIPIEMQKPSSAGNPRTETVFRGKQVDAWRLPYQPEGYDIILGMDFLT